MSTLASTFAAIVAAPLPTQDRVDLARHLLDSGQVQVTQRALAKALKSSLNVAVRKVITDAFALDAAAVKRLLR